MPMSPSTPDGTFNKNKQASPNNIIPKLKINKFLSEILSLTVGLFCLLGIIRSIS